MNPIADFSDTPLWLTFVKALFLFVYLVFSTLIVVWFERRVIGRMQQRPGPNRHGPFGLFQTLADGMKLMLKEDIRPKAADAIIFTLAPILWGTMAFVSFAIIPVGGTITLFGHTTPMQLTDLPIAVLVVLACAGVAAYGTVLAGWASGSTYPLLGGLRSTAQIISYEIAMGLSLVAVFLYAGSMSTSSIVKAQENTWFAVPLFLSFAIYVVTMVGETNRLPVDMAEGEGEIVGGYHTEYASMRFAMFFLGEYINMFTVSALATTLFLGGPAAPPGIAAIGDGALNGGWWGLLWFTIKMWLFMFMFVWLRGSLPRTRYDLFMRFGWKFLIPLAIVWLVAVAFVRAATLGYLGSASVSIAGRSIPVATIVVIAVILAVVTGVFSLVQRQMTKTAEARERQRERPIAVDPFAGGHPVPPLPGQLLDEPAWATHAASDLLPTASDRTATRVATDPMGEEYRV